MPFLSSKKKFVISTLTVSFLFVVCMVWLIYACIYVSYKNIQLEQSKILADSLRMIYEEERNVLKSLEPVLNSSMERILRSVGQQIKSQKVVTREYLKRITQEEPITSIWIIEKNGMVRLSSNGHQFNIFELYKSRPEVNWKEKFDYLIENEGAIWIDTFHKQVNPPFAYVKRGFMGLGEVANLGKVVLEIDISVEDVKKNDVKLLRQKLKSESVAYNNVIDVKFIYSDPSQPSKFQDYQVFYKNHVITYVQIKDFDNSTTQMVVTTDFPEIRKELRNWLYISIATSAFTIAVYCVLIFTVTHKFKPRREEEPKK